MGFEEMRRLRDEAKENLKTNQKQEMPSAAAAEGQTKQSKEVARTIADSSIKIFSRSIAKVLIWILQNTLLSFRDTAGRT